MTTGSLKSLQPRGGILGETTPRLLPRQDVRTRSNHVPPGMFFSQRLREEDPYRKLTSYGEIAGQAELYSLGQPSSTRWKTRITNQPERMDSSEQQLSFGRSPLRKNINHRSRRTSANLAWEKLGIQPSTIAWPCNYR